MGTTFVQMLDVEGDFHIRRAVERLRDGLFDPVAVRLLTAHEDRLNRAVDAGFRAVDSGRAPHLCVCGAYGQGKSHSLTYIQDRALREQFVTSMVNLDPREVPFHNFREVYRVLMANLRLPDPEESLIGQWRAWVAEQGDGGENGVADLLPTEMPHLFRSVLTGMAQETVSLSPRQRRTKKHASYRPRAFPYLLSRALMGEVVSVFRLRHALKYRQVDFYMDASLTCRGPEPYLQMIQALAQLFRKMGYRGWVVLFDEGESISQTRITCRSRSYGVLDRMFRPAPEVRGLFPVFAFTEEFFQQVQEEDYDRVRVRNGEEIPYFEMVYADAWKKLKRYPLQDLSPGEWEALAERLIGLHARAYQWRPPQARVRRELAERLERMQGQETRYKLKALVDQMDLAHQARVL